MRAAVHFVFFKICFCFCIKPHDRQFSVSFNILSCHYFECCSFCVFCLSILERLDNKVFCSNILVVIVVQESLSTCGLMYSNTEVYCHFPLCSVAGETAAAGDKHGGEIKQEGEWAASSDGASDCFAWWTWLADSRASAADKWQSVTRWTAASRTRPLCRNWGGAVFSLCSAVQKSAFGFYPTIQY